MSKMIEGFNTLKNIGKFKNVTPNKIKFTPLTLIYAENALGKTTISTILSSLSTGNPKPVLDRKTLGSQYPPHIVVKMNDQCYIFNNGAWTQKVPEITVFNDAFVADNVYSGKNVDSSHKKGMHDVILGKKGVELHTQLQKYKEQNEQHSSNLKEKRASIPENARGPFSVDEFCDLKEDPDIDTKLQEAEQRLAAAKSANDILQRAGFSQIVLPDFDIEEINSVLGQTLDNLQNDAANQVRAHLSSLGREGETWVAQGMKCIKKPQDIESCPFCAQSLENSPLIKHYQAYFNNAYDQLKERICQVKDAVGAKHNDDVVAAFEQSIQTAVQNYEFWKGYIEIPKIDLDNVDSFIWKRTHIWTTTRNAVLQLLHNKKVSPLEAIELSSDSKANIDKYQTCIDEIEDLSKRLLGYNEAIGIVKKQAQADNIAVLEDNLGTLKARRERFNPAVSSLCDAFLAEKKAKLNTATLLDQSREALYDYHKEIFLGYEDTINDFLDRFNASFRLAEMQPENHRYGSSASYSLVINQQNVNVSADEGPSFSNILSAGDRNTFALAFYFASLYKDSNLAQKIIVIDDPITSLDEHRIHKTIQEIINLSTHVSQVIVLSHSKSFLCEFWQKADAKKRSTYRLGRVDDGSTISKWEIENDSITEHDKQYKMVVSYIQADDPENSRNVAQALRTLLEGFIRVAYPSNFPPKKSLGSFIRDCKNHPGTIMSEDDVTKLSDLVDYAHKFHHDEAPKEINDGELKDFARRTILFLSRRGSSASSIETSMTGFVVG